MGDSLANSRDQENTVLLKTPPLL